jgi:hypothetical protein
LSLSLPSLNRSQAPKISAAFSNLGAIDNTQLHQPLRVVPHGAHCDPFDTAE